MTVEQFTNTFTSLAMLYNKEYTEEQIKVFYLVLNDLDMSLFKQACGNLAKRCKFMPTVADIREEVANIEGGEQLSLEPDHEWNEVIYCVRHFGPYKLDRIKEYLNPFTYWVADKLGWENLFNLMSDETNYMAHRFIEYFKSNQQSYKQSLQLGNDTNYQKLQGVVTTLLENKTIN